VPDDYLIKPFACAKLWPVAVPMYAEKQRVPNTSAKRKKLSAGARECYNHAEADDILYPMSSASRERSKTVSLARNTKEYHRLLRNILTHDRTPARTRVTGRPSTPTDTNSKVPRRKRINEIGGHQNGGCPYSPAGYGKS